MGGSILGGSGSSTGGTGGSRLVRPEYEVCSSTFNRYVIGNAHLKILAENCFEWVEGPVWMGDAGCLLFSDIPNNRICRWTEETGVSTYRCPSNYANGHTRDRQGRLISCEHGTRRVTRTEHDGSITVVADQFEGRKLNSPNDVVVKSDGTIWFTDPHYGIATDYEGYRSEQELSCNVYRVDPTDGAMEAVATDFQCPNGLAFSPDESLLYISDTGAAYDPSAERHIRVFDVVDGCSLRRGDVFHKVDVGVSDGIRLDSDGNVWSSAGDGVHCISPQGKLLGKILVPEKVSNLCFGGRAKHVLFMTGFTSVYSIVVNRSGVQWP